MTIQSNPLQRTILRGRLLSDIQTVIENSGDSQSILVATEPTSVSPVQGRKLVQQSIQTDRDYLMEKG